MTSINQSEQQAQLPTPYDAEIAEHVEENPCMIADSLLHMQTGYRRAQADYADLLDAAKEALKYLHRNGGANITTAGYLEAAIAKAEAQQ